MFPPPMPDYSCPTTLICIDPTQFFSHSERKGVLLDSILKTCLSSVLHLIQMQTVFESCLLRKTEDKVTAAMVRLQLEESRSLYFMETKL